MVKLTSALYSQGWLEKFLNWQWLFPALQNYCKPETTAGHDFQSHTLLCALEVNDAVSIYHSFSREYSKAGFSCEYFNFANGANHKSLIAQEHLIRQKHLLIAA